MIIRQQKKAVSSSSIEGFTLVELAMVLVIVGLLLGMSFRGRDLLDSARHKNVMAQHGKILTAINVYYEKYGALPGDGCTAGITTETVCSGTKNGSIDSTVEADAVFPILINAQFLSSADKKTAFGNEWSFSAAGTGADAGAAGNPAYNDLTLTAADSRLVCSLDRAMDDGIPTTGIIRSSASYTATSDCWQNNGTGTLRMKVLP